MDWIVPALGIWLLAMVLWRRIKYRGIKKMTIKELKNRLDNKEDVIILDVRTPEEHRAQRIPGSTLIPVSMIPFEAEKKLADREKEIVVYCASGARALSAAHTLTRMGYSRVYNLGGIGNWPYNTVSGRDS